MKYNKRPEEFLQVIKLSTTENESLIEEIKIKGLTKKITLKMK